MRRLIYPALILLPVLAQAQAKIQTSTLTAVPSTASASTLEAKANTPRVPSSAAASAAPAAAKTSDEIMVPMHQKVVERSSDGADVNDSVLGYSFGNGAAAATAPKLILASPLTMTLRDMESEATEAAVTLQLTVDINGTPKDVRIVRSGGAALDKRALESVNQYRFKPATQNTIPVEAPVTIEIKIKKS